MESNVMSRATASVENYRPQRFSKPILSFVNVAGLQGLFDIFLGLEGVSTMLRVEGIRAPDLVKHDIVRATERATSSLEDLADGVHLTKSLSAVNR